MTSIRTDRQYPRLDPGSWAPPTSVKCGLRTDVPRAQRRHDWLDAGLDDRHDWDGGISTVNVLICRNCGTDRTRRI